MLRRKNSFKKLKAALRKIDSPKEQISKVKEENKYQIIGQPGIKDFFSGEIFSSEGLLQDERNPTLPMFTQAVMGTLVKQPKEIDLRINTNNAVRNVNVDVAQRGLMSGRNLPMVPKVADLKDVIGQKSIIDLAKYGEVLKTGEGERDIKIRIANSRDGVGEFDVSNPDALHKFMEFLQGYQENYVQLVNNAYFFTSKSNSLYRFHVSPWLALENLESSYNIGGHKFDVKYGVFGFEYMGTTPNIKPSNYKAMADLAVEGAITVGADFCYVDIANMEGTPVIVRIGMDPALDASSKSRTKNYLATIPSIAMAMKLNEEKNKGGAFMPNR